MKNNKVYIIISILLAVLLVVMVAKFIRSEDINNDISLAKKNSSGPVTTFVKLVKNVLGDNNKERTFMLLLQNNMELRPGGGFIGSFAIIKTQGEKVLSYNIHDTGNFDGRIPDTQAVPYPMGEIFGIDAWKFRDSNYSPDFKTNVKKALEFYYLGDGEEQFDGVIAINASLLEEILKFTGPIKLDDFPDTYTSENVLVTLEKQVEIDFENQEINRGDRKQVIGVFFKEILNRINNLSILDKSKLFKVLVNELDQKDIQVYFNNQDLQKIIEEADWAGEVDKEWKKDYLMIVDANLGAYKSDYFIKRSINYVIDFSGNNPKVTLKIKYKHTAENENWFTKDYQSYLRAYVPQGAELESFSDIIDEPKTENDLGKTYFGGLIQVETGEEKTIQIVYTLPREITHENYKLKIQKQSGINNIPIEVNIISKDNQTKKFNMTIDRDTIIGK